MCLPTLKKLLNTLIENLLNLDSIKIRVILGITKFHNIYSLNSHMSQPQSF